MALLSRLTSGRRPARGPAAGRWVVLDVESSGLDPRCDRLLAIAAVALQVGGPRAVVDLGDSFEVVLQQAPQAQRPDRALIERALRAEALPPLPSPWLDLEPLVAVLQPQVKARSLDEWMQALGIHCAVRHQAAADTLATAELLLKLWPRLLAELPQPDFRAVQALAAHRRWLPG